ncbi:MAG: hypothetical protein KC502_13670 [Myxococcales bacterium]|nr:hypothetical protein [Myxococcales bacterium]
MNDSALEEALQTLGAVVRDAQHDYELVVVGGGALLLCGLMLRPTEDLDVAALVERSNDGSLRLITAEPFPPPLERAVHDVALALDLTRDWLNPGPTSILQFGLPSGFMDRAQTRRYASLTVHLADRIDQVHLKLYAAADHWPARLNKHLQDLELLTPTKDELLRAAAWTQNHDPSDGFLQHQLTPVLAHFDVEPTDD